jgi:predicted Zn-dependent protease with MMP-like domain
VKDKDKADVDTALDRIEALYEDEDFERARKELQRALKAFPDDLTLREWQAVFTADDGQLEKALSILDGVLSAEPDRAFAARERAAVLADLWRFDEARAQLEALLERGLVGDDPLEEALARHDLGEILDRLGRPADADRQYRKAARLAPDDCPVPLRLPRDEFEHLVADAAASIPAALQPYLDQVSIRVADYPTPGRAPAPDILGLYDGLPRTERGHDDRGHLDTVHIFQRNHETLGLTLEELREEVRKTVIHEIAHHFGLGEEDMGEYA